MIKKKLNINGVRWKLIVEPLASLAALLQSRLKISKNDKCGIGDCEDCFVIINGEVALACTTFLRELSNGAIITTKEGMAEPGSLQAVQLAWVVHGSPGCSRCSGKLIGEIASLLEINPFPTRRDMESWCNNKFFTCCDSEGILKKRIDAIVDAARVVRGEIGIDELAGMISTEKKIIDLMEIMPRKTITESAPGEIVPELGIRLPPGTLNLALVRSGVFNAKLMSIKVNEAWTVPGVYRIITSYDVQGSNILCLPAVSSQEKRFEFNYPVLCREEIKNKYEVIAVVCADSQQNALKAARKIRAKYKFFDKGDTSGLIAGGNKLEPACHPEAYNTGFAHLNNRGKVVIYSKYSLPDHYRSVIARAIGLEEEHLYLVNGNGSKGVPQDFTPIMETVLGLALLSTGRPVFLKCSNYAGEKSGSVTVQWSLQ